MEVEEIQAQACGNNNTTKFPRIGNGRIINDPNNNNNKDHLILHHYNPENDNDNNDDENHQIKRPNNNALVAADSTHVIAGNRLRGWHHSSRIIRVSRASGGKDRHSKVWTSKGLRDRRVRLSVTTAIQFYDLQDRLGYDQPSKAVEWLINAASEAISELPSLNTAAFPDTPKQLSDEKHSHDPELDLDLDHGDGFNPNQLLSLSKSACSSNSETSKGSGLSLSRSDIRVNRVKARERARERAAKDKDCNPNITTNNNALNGMNPISQNASFTELLTSGINNNNNNNQSSSSPTTAPMTPMDYFSTGFHRPHNQIQLGNSLPMSMSIPFEAMHQQPSQFSFVPEQHLIPSQTGDYSLSFSMASSGIAGFNRGTLQSNSSHSSLLMPHHRQRFASPIDGSANVPFFFGAAAPAMENIHSHQHQQHHHQFPAGFDGQSLQLCYGDRTRNSDQKGKGKN